MEGLEVSELSYREYVLSENETFRFDSEYFKKESLRKINKLKKLSSSILADVAEVKGGKRLPLNENFAIEGIPYIRAENVKNSFIQYRNSPCISEKTHQLIAPYQARKNDVLLTIVGNSIGDVGIIKFNLDKCNLTENCVKITPKNSKCANFSDYLFLFFMSNYGQIQIKRETVGTAQPKLAIERIRRFLIPILSVSIQKIFTDTVASSNNLLLASEKKYTQAENILLDALGLTNFSPSTEKINIKSFNDSFAATGRLDAEYYLPRYEDYQNHIFAYPNGWKLLNQICNLKDFNYNPNDISEYQYIELADIDNSGGITGCTSEVGKNLPSRARRKVQTGDVLVSSIEGSLSSCAIVPKIFNDALCSTGFYVVNSEQVNSETLLILFKCELMQNILKQNCSGTILTAINKTDFLNIPLPIIAPNTQAKIASRIQESFALKAESERLLEVAKRAVEIAIEQDEKAAMQFLHTETKLS